MRVFLLSSSVLGVAVADWRNVVFDSPTAEPGKNRAKQPIISGGMPIGNGETAALVFPVTQAFNATPDFGLREGVHIWVSMATAMASDQSIMSLGVVSIETDPPLGVNEFRQTLVLENGSVEISTAVGTVTSWVDALTNRVVVSVRGSGDRKISTRVSVQSLRPKTRFAYNGRCSSPTSAADEWIQPAGAHAVGLSHRNDDSDIALLNKAAAFNATLDQQGLGAFADRLQGSDRWRNLQFGLLVSGDGLTKHGGTSGLLHTSEASNSLELVITTLSKQTASSDLWQEDIAALHGRHVASLAQAWGPHQDHWTRFWNQSHIWVSGNASLETLTERYAQTRYLQAIQAGTWVPIKFNGMLFTAQLPPVSETGGPDFRKWGSSNWWQNTRLAYWNMLASGDFGLLRNIFEYYLQMMDFMNIRTQAAFNHTGIYTTETSTLFGAFDPCDYGTPAAQRHPSELNFGYEESRFLKYDFGGDAGLTELCVMLLDFYASTLDGSSMRRYMPLLAGTLDFFSRHYGDVMQTKLLKIFPTQGLETYQCPIEPVTPENCPTNDHPTVAALYVLTERALELPAELSTEAQRERWQALRAALPPVPMIEEEGVIVVSPYETYPNAKHEFNCETPELYSTHPFRYFTLARSKLSGPRGRDIGPSIYCLEESTRKTCRNADLNVGWTQGLLNAALLGRTNKAARLTLERALVRPAVGYRFPAFAGHYQDYEPSEDHFANMNTALQLMLLSPGDDGFDTGSALLFPAWPCEWDVDFKLAAPRRTIVSGRLVGGKLVEFEVDPPERKAAITVLPCQSVAHTTDIFV